MSQEEAKLREYEEQQRLREEELKNSTPEAKQLEKLRQVRCPVMNDLF